MLILRMTLTRLWQGAIVVLLTALIIFTLLRSVPGDPVRLIVGGMAPPEVVEQVAKDMGLRDPIPVQFVRYLSGLLHGDIGTSFTRPKSGAVSGGTAYNDPMRGERAPVLDLIKERLPLTLLLAAVAAMMAIFIAVPVGVAAGLRPSGWPGRLAVLLSATFISMPNFWLGIVLTLLLSVYLGWLPSIGYHGPAYVILPAFVIALEIAPVLIRALMVSVTDVMGEHFIEAGEVRGLRRRTVIFRHALRNVMVPILNVMGIQISTLIGGVLVIEFIFDYPGIGHLMAIAVLQRDFPIIQGVAILTSLVFVLINLAVDIVAVTLDPRLAR